MKIRYYLLAICLLSPGVFADDVLWKSGNNLYIKLTDKETKRGKTFLPNAHPVSLNPQEIRNTLNGLLVWHKSFFTGALKDEEEAETVFSLEQSRLLGNHIAAGLQKATAQQDIVFALTRRTKSFLFMKDTTYTAGRAFYADGKLNVIIGDYNRLGDKFKERAHESHGMSDAVKYYFKPGKRAKRSGFDKAVIIGEGIDTKKVDGKNRADWFVLDVTRASKAFLARQAGEDPQQTNSVNDELIRAEAAKLAKERREMRLEMARLRKEMNQGGGQQVSVEERLKKLDKLKENNIITEDEYQAKRKEILADL